MKKVFSFLVMAGWCWGDVALEFNPKVLMKPLPAIEEAAFLKAEEVEDEVFEDELVLGVVVGGEARAYPVNMMNGPRREIINDRVGGQAIAATW